MSTGPAGRRLLVVGSSGFLGRRVTRDFSAGGWSVATLSRRPGLLPGADRAYVWAGAAAGGTGGAIGGEWERAIDTADVVLNLAGRSVNCRYTPQNRREIEESRWVTTRLLARAISRADSPPALWLNASSATVYRHAEDRPMTEADGEIGDGFSVSVVQEWEKALFETPLPATRRVALRTALVLGREDGVWPVFNRLARLGLAGPMAGGRQRVSWVHEGDFVRAVDWLASRSELVGPVNIAAPGAVTNAEFLREFRRSVRAPVGLPAARWMLELGALVMRTETELLLKSRWVAPERLEQDGFTFRYPRLPEALRDLAA